MASKGTTFVAAGAALMAMTAVAIIRRRRYDFHGASVLITGGSRGLGLELARQLAGEGARLNLIARDRTELERARRELAGQGADVLIFLCDLRREEDIERTVAAVQGVRGRIDVLINNAGIIQVGPEENQQLEDYRQAMAIHAWAPLLLMRGVIPIMKRQGGGRIVNISSIGGLVAVPHLLPYCMSKFALTGLSDGMRNELARDNILVTTVAPGLMRTGSHVRAFFKGAHAREFAWFSLSGANPLLSTTPEKTARRIIGASRYGKPRLIVTLPAMLLHGLNANFPDVTAMALSLANRLLPGAMHPEGDRLKPGWQCRSPLAPSLLTRLADRAVARNNEAP
jgi:NAD(P)-dependent dehydrogenase (short-subunit alcohol dehydrogenase family)